jgi:16S rRNA (cytidine1402-2'-O)-methyltransferase
MTTAPGRLLLVPTPLDFGVDESLQRAELQESLPLGVIRQAAALTHWVAENARSARAFLKRVDVVVPLAQPLQSISIAELPRPPKGKGAAAQAAAVDLAPWLSPALAGLDIGLVSEAGLPAVADPGAALVQRAHELDVPVVALAGASALLLALASSGFNGQAFAFVGYLPQEAGARAARVRELELLSRRTGQAQLMIETPYRNQALLDTLAATLQPTSRLSVSCGLALPGGWTRSDPASAWRSTPCRMPSGVPAVFVLQAK